MTAQKFSENMKKVICGLSLHPEMNIKKLSKEISVNTSTISTSIQRMKDRDLINKQYIPDFFNLDTGVVIIASGKYRYQFPEDIRESIIGFVTQPAVPFLILSDNISWFVMSLMPPDRSEYEQKHLVKLNNKYTSEMTFDVTKEIFNTNDTKIWRYFDFSHLLCNIFSMDIQLNSCFPSTSFSYDDLKKNEKIIMENLIRKSATSDYQRSHVLGISHPAVTKIRKDLIDRGIIRSIVFPNMKVLGFSTFAWFNIKFEGKEIEKHLINNLCNYPNNILSIQNQNNIIILSCFSDMKDLMIGQQKIDEFMSNAMISYEDIIFNYFSIEHPSFQFKTNPVTAFQVYTNNNESEEKAGLLASPYLQLPKILKLFFSEKETTYILDEIKYTLNVDMSSNSLESTMSIILELLTEPIYLSPLKDNQRAALQAKLINELNSLRARIDSLSRYGAKKEEKKVMIVEDSKAMVEMLKDMLLEANYKISGICDNGQEAFELYTNLCDSNNRPDVILMDVFIKGMNGIEATKMIKEYDPLSSIVVLTSSPDTKIKAQMTSLDIDEYLIKPVTQSQLIDCLNQSIIKKGGFIK
jgi:CheY-like chemotaxis protein